MIVGREKADFEAIVLGTSAGGFEALTALLPKLSAGFPLPLLIVIHRTALPDPFLASFLDTKSQIRVKEAEDQEDISPGVAYIAPPNYHILVNRNKTIALSTMAPIHYSRPAIDPLFESAAEVYFERLIAIILTGANHDGSEGIKSVADLGGLPIIEDPHTAQVAIMPSGALEMLEGKGTVLSLEKIPQYLNTMAERLSV